MHDGDFVIIFGWPSIYCGHPSYSKFYPPSDFRINWGDSYKFAVGRNSKPYHGFIFHQDYAKATNQLYDVADGILRPLDQLPRSEWDRWLIVERLLEFLILSGQRSISVIIYNLIKKYQCQRFKKPLFKKSKEIIICKHCKNTAFYGINALLQSGYVEEALELLNS